MSEFKSHFAIKTGSEKSFGFVFCSIFAIYAAWPLFHGNPVRMWAFLISFILLIITLYKPDIFIIPNKIWSKLGVFLGTIVSPIVMAIIFFVSVVPTGLIMRVFGKDLLCQKFDKNRTTYWIIREKTDQSMKNQF